MYNIVAATTELYKPPYKKREKLHSKKIFVNILLYCKYNMLSSHVGKVHPNINIGNIDGDNTILIIYNSKKLLITIL